MCASFCSPRTSGGNKTGPVALDMHVIKKSLEDVFMAETLNLPVLPLDDAVVLPTMVVPMDMSDGEVRAAIEAARAAGNRPDVPGIRSATKPRVLLVPRLDGKYSPVGALGTVEQIGRLPDGEPGAVVRGVSRVRIGAGTTGPGGALWVQATVVDERPASPRAEELAREYRALATTILQKRGAYQVIDALQQLTQPSALADSAGYAPYLTIEQKAELLQEPDPEQRLERLTGWAREHLAEMEVAEAIGNDVREGMEKQQREFLLRQQLAAIRKELAELDGRPESEEDDYRARVEAANLPDKVAKAALREVEKLERASANGAASPEAGWIRTWLDTVLEMPWNERTEDSYDIAAARAVLDADHAGLPDVKDRIIEYLAVRERRASKGLSVVGGRRSGAVLGLVGPPGVGKTSLGESVARAMGRKFARVSLGGIRDEAEIRGHRRTYVGALPGRIVRAIREAGSMNPVILLDEVDKVGADFRGDPTAALLEVLDPAQNHTFRDHYLEVELDLSDVLFLATANVSDAIPGPLLDRMELVTLDGYTEQEKVTIARQHLVPRQISRAALSDDDVTISDEALRRIAAEYTREAGVRQLERALTRVLRKVATKLASSPGPLVVDDTTLRDYLGRPRFTPESAERTAVPGVATGLAVTGTGGDVLFIEASAMDGTAGLTLTGQLGDVMKESAQIALSSLASGRPVRADVGMTGEVTLNGRVLPIGGVRQKLLAAQRAGLKTVFLPERNEPGLEDVPADVLAELDVRTVGDVADILAYALDTATAHEVAA